MQDANAPDMLYVLFWGLVLNWMSLVEKGVPSTPLEHVVFIVVLIFIIFAFLYLSYICENLEPCKVRGIGGSWLLLVKCRQVEEQTNLYG